MKAFLSPLPALHLPPSFSAWANTSSQRLLMSPPPFFLQPVPAARERMATNAIEIVFKGISRFLEDPEETRTRRHSSTRRGGISGFTSAVCARMGGGLRYRR